jgi:hypothetical protein
MFPSNHYNPTHNTLNTHNIIHNQFFNTMHTYLLTMITLILSKYINTNKRLLSTGTHITNHIYSQYNIYNLETNHNNTVLISYITYNTNNSAMVLLIIESHIQSYCIPNNISYLWNIGFILILFLGTQVFTGLLLTLNYISNTTYAYSSVMYINRDISYGWYLHYTHSSNVSILMLLMYIHIARGLYINSFILNSTLWISGIVILGVFIVIAFMGYVLTWGQISFWGVTVIKNIVTSLPCLIE